MFKRLLNRFMLLEGEGATDAPAGGAAAAAPTDAGLMPPASLLNDTPAEVTPPKEGEKPEAGESKEGETATKEPIKYTDFTLPEGVELNSEKLGEFSKIASEAGVSQEVAQKFVDLYTSELKQQSEAPYRAWTDLQNQWQAEVRNDPVIGGANLDKNLAATKAGLNALLGEDSKAFYEALNITGAGNNPAIIRGLFKAAQSHAPATPVNGSPGGGKTKSAGATLYPTMAGLGNGHEG
jgi:hypothetical protein